MFDQHNSLTPEQRLLFPYSIAEGLLTTLTEWRKTGLLVVISASANNKYFLKVASDNKWPQFIMDNGFNEEEFNAWAKQENFFPGVNLADIKYWTNLIPYLPIFGVVSILFCCFVFNCYFYFYFVNSFDYNYIRVELGAFSGSESKRNNRRFNISE